MNSEAELLAQDALYLFYCSVQCAKVTQTPAGNWLERFRSRELAMPTLTTEKSKTSATFRLNGKLTGPVVTELETSWRVAKHQNLGGLRLDLRKVKEIDDTGKDLLKRMFCDGVQFVVAAHPQRNR